MPVPGKIYFVEDEDGVQIASPSWVPGSKHMIDNIIGDVLERLGQFKQFQSCLKAWPEACINIGRAVIAFEETTTMDYGQF